MKIDPVLLFASASHLQDGEDGTFVPLKEGAYSADALPSPFPRDVRFSPHSRSVVLPSCRAIALEGQPSPSNLVPSQASL